MSQASECPWRQDVPGVRILGVSCLASGCPASKTTDRKQTDRVQRRLAEKGDPKYIFTIPRAILPKPSRCDKITATKSVTKPMQRNRRFAASWSRSVDLARHAQTRKIIISYC